MGYVINPVEGNIFTLKFNLIKNDLITMGSTPIVLPGTDLGTNTVLYVPFNAFFIWTSGTNAFDFAAGDHPQIMDNNGTGISWQWFSPLQNFGGIGDISFATYRQRTHNNFTFAADPSFKKNATLQLTTATGNDATVGDMNFDLYLTYFKINL